MQTSPWTVAPGNPGDSARKRVLPVQDSAAAHTLPQAKKPERVGGVAQGRGASGENSLTPRQDLQACRVARVGALAGHGQRWCVQGPGVHAV